MAHIESANETNETIPYKSLHNQRHRVLGTFFPAPIEWFPLAISLQCFCRLRSSVKSTQNCPFSSINGLPPKVSLRLRILTDRDFTFICSYLLERNLRFFVSSVWWFICLSFLLRSPHWSVFEVIVLSFQHHSLESLTDGTLGWENFHPTLPVRRSFFCPVQVELYSLSRHFLLPFFPCK